MTRIRLRTAPFSVFVKHRSINTVDGLWRSMDEEQVEEIMDRFDRIAENGERRDSPEEEEVEDPA